MINSGISHSRILVFIFIVINVQAALANQFCDGQNCFDCYYKCKTCFGKNKNQCLSCFDRYLLANNSCISCGKNCISCVQQNELCQACANNFYLSQSTGKCQTCPKGAQTCTFSAIQQCLSGYYIQNSLCIKCISNCVSCNDASSCSQCQSGYYLQTVCLPCQISNCSSCSSKQLCELCIEGHYGPQCQDKCPYFCKICDSQICYQCMPQYYLNNDGFCSPLSILCHSGQSQDQCQKCIEDISSLWQKSCYPYPQIHYINQQEYYRPFNQIQLFSGSLNKCQGLYYAQARQILNILISYKPSYLLKIKSQLIIQKNQTKNIKIFSNNSQQIYSSLINMQQQYNCESKSIVKNNLQILLTPKNNHSHTHFMILSFQSVQKGLIGVSQLVIQYYLCQVQHCSRCLTPYTCYYCQDGYKIQNNACVESCTFGYYLTIESKSCTLSCKLKYFPILQEYICYSCISPCQTCSSLTKCNSCLIGWFLLNLQCLIDCPKGYYKNNFSRQCNYCRFPCQTCDNDRQNCTSCLIGYFNKQFNNCTIKCPLHYFSNFKTLECTSCALECQQCDLLPDKCLSCSKGLYLNQNNSCLSTCEQGFIANTKNMICQKCLYPCKNCLNLSNQCLQCYSGYLLNYSCINYCPSGYYEHNNIRTCMICQNNCETCSSKFQCNTCKAGFYYLSNKSCLAQCPFGFYSNNSNCLSCLPPCTSCTNATYCLTCYEFKFAYYHGSCLLRCPSSTYIAYQQITKSKICKLCSINCRSCISDTQCFQCSNSVLYNGSCLNHCPNFTYIEHGKCRICLIPCKQCTSNDKCSSCIEGYVYFQSSNSCLRSCPHNYLNISYICQRCNNQCSTCKDSQKNCIQCNTGFVKNRNGSCLLNCQIGYYQYTLQKICKACSSNCKQCISQRTCTSCQSTPGEVSLHLFRNRCLTVCPQGYYSNQNLICLSCSMECKQCSIKQNNCTKCPYNKYLSPTTFQCKDSCPLGFFETQGSICNVCASNCKNCISMTVCLQCSSHMFVLQNGQCLSSCLFGQFYILQNNKSKKCKICDPKCLQCYMEKDNCTSCFPGLALSPIKLDKITRQCLQYCPDSYYQDVLNQQCVSCSHPCQLCITKSHCLSCITGYYLYKDSCILNCIQGYFKNNSQCILCTAPCKNCYSQQMCLSCLNNYFYDQKLFKCLSECNTTQYAYKMSNGQLQCINCSVFCHTCYDSSACKSCHINSQRPYLQGTSCQSNCTEGYYSNNQSLTCLQCSWGCISCLNIQICTKCLNSHLYKGNCLVECPIKFYSTLNFICQYCNSPCFSCYDAINCLTCIDGYYLYQKYCLQECPQNYWHVASLRNCNKTCNSPYYMIQKSKNCVLQCNKYHDRQSSCQQYCNADEMANQSLGCESCATADCQKRLQFQTIMLQNNRQLILMLIFNLPLDDFNSFNIDTIELQLQQSIFNAAEIDLQGLRTLQQTNKLKNSFILQIIQRNQYFIKIKINTPNLNVALQGKLKTLVKDIKILRTSGYPLQMHKFEFHIDWYHPNQSGYFTYYLAIVISVVFFILFIINVIFNKNQHNVLMVDGLPNLHIIFYLQFWNHPLVQNYLLGLQNLALRSYMINFSKGNLWNCSPKYIVLFGACNLYSQLMLPIIFILIMLVLVFICRFIPFLAKKHQKMIGHVGILWWMCSSIGISSFRGITQSKYFTELIICILLSSLYLLLSIVLAYIIIKNVFSLSFQDTFFFWNLKKRKTNQQLSNLHHFMIIIRRIVLIAAVGFNEKSPLSCLFILTLITIFIVSNIIINSPFKKYNLSLGLSQGLFALILILLQMYIVNAAKISNSQWNLYGIAVLIIIIVYSFVIMILSSTFTFKYAIKFYKTFSSKKSIQAQIKEIQQVQGQKIDNEKQQTEKQQDKKQLEQKLSEQFFHKTDEEFIKKSEEIYFQKNSMNSKSVSSQNQSVLKDDICLYDQSQYCEDSLNPARVLIKVPKVNQEKQEQI